jgi:hypothetical protein
LSTSSLRDGSGQSRHDVRIPSEFQPAVIAGSWLDLFSGARQPDKIHLYNSPCRSLEKPWPILGPIGALRRTDTPMRQFFFPEQWECGANIALAERGHAITA